MFISGNAYFAHFFLVSQNPRTLKQAMSAYSQVIRDIIIVKHFFLTIEHQMFSCKHILQIILKINQFLKVFTQVIIYNQNLLEKENGEIKKVKKSN